MPEGRRWARLSPARLMNQGPEYWRAHWRKVLLVKVTGVVVSITLVLTMVSGEHTRELFVLLVGGVYLPLSLVLFFMQQKDPAPPNAAWFAITLSDIAVVATAQALFPRLTVAFLGLTAIVLVSAVLLGVRWALAVSVAAVAALHGASVWGVPGQPSLFSVITASLLLMAIAFLIGNLAEGERLAADRSRRLAQAIAFVGSSLEVPVVLESLCEAARDSLDGAFSVVLMREKDHLAFGAGSGHPSAFSRMKILVEDLIKDPTNRLAVTVEALRTLEPVTIDDVARSSKLPGLVESGRKMGIRAGAAVPILWEGDAIGVLNVYLPRPYRFTTDDVEFLVALAEQAGLAIERATLFAKEREAADGLRELDRLRSEFVSTVSHELRTPLTAIEGFAFTLQRRWRDVTPELRDEMLDRLGDNARSLDHLITHLLDFGRLERGLFQVQPEQQDAGVLVRRVLENMVHEVAGHQVVTEIPAGLTVMVDRFAFDRILGNLVSNAAKFSPAGTDIEVAAQLVGDAIRFRVRDHGPGIPDESKQRIFERFYRGDLAARGTGIGLAVAKDLAELHAGRIEVSNAPGGGSMFDLYLPAAPAAGDAEPGDLTSRAASERRPASASL